MDTQAATQYVKNLAKVLETLHLKVSVASEYETAESYEACVHIGGRLSIFLTAKHECTDVTHNVWYDNRRADAHCFNESDPELSALLIQDALKQCARGMWC